MINQKRAYLYAGIAIFFWSTIATAFKIGLQEINLIQFLFFASWTSFLILLIINVYKGNLKKISDLSLKEIALSALMGALNPFAYYLILFRAYELLTAQVAQPLNMIWPIVLVFFSVIFLGQKFRAISFLALFISFIGVYFISSQGDPWSFHVKAPLGVALAAGSSIIWSAYWILNVKKGGDETFQLGLNFFFAAIFISLLLLAIDGFQNLSLLGTGLAVYSGVF